MKLLRREEFEKQVFERADSLCEVPDCAEKAADAHHIIERDQWQNGGYYKANGIALCSLHHRDAEADHFPPAACWYWLGISNPPLPEGIDEPYVNCSGQAVETYDLREATKYPSTSHLSVSPNQGAERNDVIDTKKLTTKPLVVTTKMDGSNVQLSQRRVAARNAKHARHPSFDQLKALYASKKPELPEDIVLFGEWLYAKHSIHYKNLRSYLQIFGAYYRPLQLWLSWSQVEKLTQRLGLKTVPVETRLRLREPHGLIEQLNKIGKQRVEEGHEGIVVRNALPFYYTAFGDNVAKYVREGHVQSDEHWRHQAITPNELMDS